MSTRRASNPPRRSRTRSRVALALAGGGPLGAIYEIGALCALQDSLTGIDFNALDHYVGVSAGGFIAACLANGISPRDLQAAFIDGDPSHPDAFDPAWMTEPAWDEWLRRSAVLPGLAASAGVGWLLGRHTLVHALERLGAALPTGLFSSQAIHHRLAALFSAPGRSNDFRQLGARLTLVATNLDSGEAAPFGRPGWDHVPISMAVQASSALPGLFPPVQIDGQCYVDGALKKTMHASVALDDGVDLMLCLNPLVPFDATPRAAWGGLPWLSGRPIPRIVDGGLPAVLSQTFRTLIHSRLEMGMRQYEHSYPDTDIVLIEPDHRDPELYLANTFSYGQRRHLAEHAFQQTRALLRSPRVGLAAKLARHGIGLQVSRLNDPHRHLGLPMTGDTRIGRSMRALDTALERLASVVDAPRPAAG